MTSANGSNDDARIEELVAACLDRLEAGDPAGVDAICAAHPDVAVALRRRIDLLERVGLVAHVDPARPEERTNDESAPRDPVFPERLGEFTLLRRIGGGGMGVVYLARQDSLQREVALKLIRPESAYFGGAKERFRREVDAVARLNHAGIVPIHTVGETKGIPYFAMEFIEGLSLSEIVDRCKERGSVEHLAARHLRGLLLGVDEESEVATEFGTRLGPTWVQAMVRIVMQVAEALEHAHARGVTHRDVKPSNVIVTREGRAVLVDFGLAAFGNDHALTKSGNAIGSPPYMAPEVCAGGGCAADARTDVYALGVSLYELLTLKRAFAGDAADVFARILSADYAPLRRLNPSVPRDLETVCHKAMDLDQDRRYATAEAFASDLRNVLELRPIRAGSATTLSRIRRFVQRRPALAMTFVLIFFITVVFPLGYSQVLAIKGRELEFERSRAASARNVAFDALQTILDAVNGEHLPDVPEVTEYRRRVLVEAENVIARIERDGGLRPELTGHRILIERGAATLAMLIGRYDEVVERTSRLLDELGRFSGLRSIAADDEAARLHRLRALSRYYLRLTDGAITDANASLAHWRERFRAASPPRVVLDEYLESLTAALPIFAVTGDRELEAKLVRELGEVYDRAVVLFPDQTDIVIARLKQCSMTGVRAAYEGRREEAEAARVEIAALLQELERAGATIEDSTVAPLFANLAELEMFRGDADAATRMVGRAIDSAKRLVDQHPEQPIYGGQRARALSMLASYQLRIGRADPSRRGESFAAARAALEEAVVVFRGIEGYLDHQTAASSDFASALGLLGNMLLDARESARAEVLLQEAVERLALQTRANPRNWTDRANYAKTLEALADARRQLLRPDEALSTLESARLYVEETRALGIVPDSVLEPILADNLLLAADIDLERERLDVALSSLAELRRYTKRVRDVRGGLVGLAGCYRRYLVVDPSPESTAGLERSVDLAIDFLGAARSIEGGIEAVRADTRLEPLRGNPRYAAAERGAP